MLILVTDRSFDLENVTWLFRCTKCKYDTLSNIYCLTFLDCLNIPCPLASIDLSKESLLSELESHDFINGAYCKCILFICKVFVKDKIL